MNNLADTVLLALYIQGQEDAFIELVRRYQPLLEAYLKKIFMQQTVVEDLVQETFYRVLQNLWRFDSQQPFAPWIFTIAINLAKMELRKRKRFSIWQRSQKITFHYDPDNIAKAEEYNLLEEALNSLSTPQRRIVKMRLEGLSYKEIAQELKCPTATARTRFFYALQKIKEYTVSQN